MSDYVELLINIFLIFFQREEELETLKKEVIKLKEENVNLRVMYHVCSLWYSFNVFCFTNIRKHPYSEILHKRNCILRKNPEKCVLCGKFALALKLENQFNKPRNCTSQI